MENGNIRQWAGFHLPSSIFHFRFLVPLALAIFILGCSPSGPRALLKGKKFLDCGDYTGAVTQLKMATSLLATNAPAWNYLGLAYHHAGRPADAVVAYQRALALDRDLIEAHYNLGCLWLEQNKPDLASTEFTTYTLRRGNAPEGWLKLGLAQLRLQQPAGAEKSFNTALYLNSSNAEALNGLGLVNVQRGRPRDAAQDFSAALKARPDYAPAILNLATVAQQYLRDNKLALQYYRAYLVLTPRPANWDEVNAVAQNLEQPATVATANQPASSARPNPAPPPANASGAKTQTTGTAHPAASARPQPNARSASNPPPPQAEPPVEVVNVQPEPVIVATPDQTAPVAATPGKPTSSGAPAEKSSVWHKLNPVNWFHSSTPEKTYAEDGVTPLPSPGAANTANPAPTLPVSAVSSTPAAEARPIKIVAAAPPVFPRYLYLSPRKPKPGDRARATSAFNQAQGDEKESRWSDAMNAYQQAAEADPGWFEAQYNFGVLSYRLHNYLPALAAFETALAIRPDSVDARYMFALTLKAAGYVPDAVYELGKILKANPDEVRAHLALGNLYAQQMHDVARARQHYLKVLALDPGNAHASDIQFWLSSNPP